MFDWQSSLSSSPGTHSGVDAGVSDDAASSVAGFETTGVCALVATLAQTDVHTVEDSALLDAAIGLADLMSYAQCAQAHVLAELDARATTDTNYGMRTVSWVASQTGCSRGPITGHLRVGRALRHHYTTLDAALAAGEISFDHAKAVCDTSNPRNIDALAGVQNEIIALANGATFDQFKRDVTTLAELTDTNGTKPDDLTTNKLSMPVTIDDTIKLDGTFTREHGLALRHAINTKADELLRRFTRDHERCPDLEVPGRATLRALALAELVRTAIGAEPGSGSVPRAEITLVLHNHETCDTDGEPIPQAAANVWGCDPDLWAVVVNNMGIPVDVGHTHRLATIAQRRAITIRDGGCTFPGCDAPINWCDYHHIQPWNHGGPTNQTNLVALCRHHHGITHRTGWTMHLDNHQIPHWTTPTGHHLTGQRHHRQC